MQMNYSLAKPLLLLVVNRSALTAGDHGSASMPRVSRSVLTPLLEVIARNDQPQPLQVGGFQFHPSTSSSQLVHKLQCNIILSNDLKLLYCVLVTVILRAMQCSEM